MVFTTLIFVCFATIYFIFLPLFAKAKNLRLAYTTIMSLVFYGWGNPWWILLLLLSGLIDYNSALFIERWKRWRNYFLVFSLIANLGILGLFKYSLFAAESFDSIMAAFGISSNSQSYLPNWSLILPIGISFYTFQSMSYTIDVWRGKMAAVKNPLSFFAYLSLFPQLVAGPIVRAIDLVHLVEHPAPCPMRKRMTGLWLIISGFFQKAVFADNIAPYVDAAFASPVPAPDALHWWWIALLFAIQIYCDFSGYTRIARGLGVWMGMRYPANFRHPYIAHSFRDFWSRWHISLSSWFRDYVYIPLGGSRVPTWRIHLNIGITMVLSGLWHGAAWHFVIWGASHACLLSIEKVTRWPERLKHVWLGHYFSIMIVFSAILLTWILFRSNDLSQAASILLIMIGYDHSLIVWDSAFYHFVPLILAGAFLMRECISLFQLDWPLRRIILRHPWLEASILVLIVLLAVCCRGQGHQFIYFQF